MNEDEFLRNVKYVAWRIVQSHKAKRKLEVWIYWVHIGFMVIFSLAGAVGLLKVKADGLKEGLNFDQGWSWGFVLALASFVGIVVLELYRAYQVERIALKRLAAFEAFSLIEKRTENALAQLKPWDQFEAVYMDSQTLAVTFSDVLQGEHEADVQRLIDQWKRSFQPAKGWKLPTSQQKRK